MSRSGGKESRRPVPDATRRSVTAASAARSAVWLWTCARRSFLPSPGSATRWTCLPRRDRCAGCDPRRPNRQCPSLRRSCRGRLHGHGRSRGRRRLPRRRLRLQDGPAPSSAPFPAASPASIPHHPREPFPVRAEPPSTLEASDELGQTRILGGVDLDKLKTPKPTFVLQILDIQRPVARLGTDPRQRDERGARRTAPISPASAPWPSST